MSIKMVVANNNVFESQLKTLKSFEKLSAVRSNHLQLLLDKKVILYAATLLDQDNLEIVKRCLDIFENLLKNPETHASLLSTFGVYESLESLVIRARKIDESVYKRASKITETLRNVAPPALNTRSRTKERNNQKKSAAVYLLYIPNLTEQTKNHFESVLVRIKGVISFLIDMEVKRCTLRLCPKVTVKEVVEKISNKCGLKCLIVSNGSNKQNNEEQVETLFDALEIQDRSYYLEYNMEELNDAAIMAQQERRKSTCGLFGSVRNFWNESFYW